jgi:hypothetical protein
MSRRWGWKRSLSGGLALVSLGAIASCHRSGDGLPPQPEFAAAQRAVWQKAPADALGGMVIGDVGHLLGRLRALRAVAASGPVTRAYLDRATAAVVNAFGFDPLEEAGWREAGADPTGPLGVFVGPGDTAQVVFRATDSTAASRAAARLHDLAGTHEPFDCGPAGELYRCGSPDWKLAEAPAASLWPHLEKNLAAERRAMELVAYTPFDRGEARAALDKEGEPWKSLRAGYLTMTATPERLVLRGGAVGDDFARLLPYLTPRPGVSAIGLATGAVGAARFTFSPDKLWVLLQGQLGKLGAPEAGVVNAVAGFDLEKDLVQNLTGELVYASYRSDKKTGADGKRRSYNERLGGVGVLGTLDDAKTRKLADRLGELIGGAIGSFGAGADALGMKLAYRSEGSDRKVHWIAVDLDAEHQKLFGIGHVELFLTSIPGGLAVGAGPVGLEELRLRIGKKPAEMLARLPLAEERAAFQSSPLVLRGEVGEEFAFGKLPHKIGEAGFSPEIASVIAETAAMFQLVFDGMMAAEVGADRGEFVYQLSFL